jgi:hypothetical protein
MAIAGDMPMLVGIAWDNVAGLGRGRDPKAWVWVRSDLLAWSLS